MRTEQEYTEGLANLENVGNQVDVILSHCAPSSIQDIFGGGFYKKDQLTDYLDQIRVRCTFKRWFFGHYHENMEIGQKFVMLYEMIIPLLEYLPEEDVQ